MSDTEAMAVVIVVAVDSSEASDAALCEALRAAAQTGGQLHLVHAAAPSVSDGQPSRVSARQAAVLEQLPRMFRHKLQRMNGGRVALPRVGEAELHICVGAPASVILAVAAELEASLVVVGCHGRAGDAGCGLGSTAEQVVRRANCGVLVARRAPREGTRVRAPTWLSAEGSETETAQQLEDFAYRSRVRLNWDPEYLEVVGLAG